MITILHGDHQVESRNRLRELTAAARISEKELIILDGPSLDLTDLVQSLETTSLFGGQKLVVIENLLSSLRAGAKRDEIMSYLIRANFDTDVVLWEKGSVGRQLITLKKQKHVSVEEFKMPRVIFNFVDNLQPRNTAALLDSFHQTIEHNVVAEVIFIMIIRQFRLMLALQTGAEISESKRLAPWQRGKLSKQAHSFSSHDIKKSYKELLLIDYQTKTGKSPLNLTQRIEQFIIGL
ncbi:hypothetical protein HY469_01190 [Candidatus Roizmanbacteria bacterium]|nr:hypothetical protein [Candidatus Roizmanbacteria bacterium]